MTSYVYGAGKNMSFFHSQPILSELQICRFRRRNFKHEILNLKQTQMTKIQSSKQYELEERILKFAQQVTEFAKGQGRF